MNIQYTTVNDIQSTFYLSGFTMWDDYGYGYLNVMQGSINLFQEGKNIIIYSFKLLMEI